MSTHGNIGLNLQENIPDKLNDPKNMMYASEAIIIEDTCKQKCRPNLPTVKDTIQILNKANIRPSIPINETALLNKQCKSYLMQSLFNSYNNLLKYLLLI